MTIPNYAAEGRIREACAAAGVRIECLEDVITRYRAGQFNEAELDGKLAEWRGTPGHHFFSGTAADLDAEAVAAFGEQRTLKAQGEFLREHGEAKAAEIAAQFGTALGGKPGKTPDAFKPKKPNDPNAGLPKGTTNPFSKDGWSLAKQGSLLKAVGIEKTAQIAAAVGAKIGDTRPNPKF
jgi:hypothetical protein